MRDRGRRRGLPQAGGLLLVGALALLMGRPARGFTVIRRTTFADPPSSWATTSLPLATLISSAGSDNVPDATDTNAIIAAQQTWNAINTNFFAFATPVVGTGTALNASDGKNSIFFDEAGVNFPAGTTAIAFTSLNFSASTGIISDADLVFNGRDDTFSTATPTPANVFDIQSIATHELGHVQGLDHAGLTNAVMFPIGADGQQFQRLLASDDRIGVSSLYPESVAGAGLAALQGGDGDLAQMTGTVSGTVQTATGLAVPGAHVVALDQNGLSVVSDVARIDGSYTLGGLFPGGYQIYAEPMDGVLVEQDLAQGDFMNSFTPFNTTFLGGNPSPTTLSVTAGATSSGNTINLGNLYGTETEGNNTAPAANPVALEALTSGIVNPAGDLDFFSFPGTLGDIVSIDADASGDACPLDPVLTLFSTNGTTQLATNDDFLGKGNDSRVARILPATGTFFFRMQNFGVNPQCPNEGPGSFYTVHVNKSVAEVESNNTMGAANPATFGQYRGGLINPSGDVDFYSFTAKFGDRIIAEVTANRAGSTLNPTLTLLTAAGATLATSTDITGTNLDSQIDFTFVTNGTTIPSLPATFFLRVTAAAGAGTNAFYVLHMGTDSLNTLFSGISTLGTGLGGLGFADIFPKFVNQGSSFDLTVAGFGIPFDPADTITITGPGITTFPTAGPQFGSNAQGDDFLSFSAMMGTGAPGPHTIFLQNATLKSAISGGLVLRATAVPAEPGQIFWQGEQQMSFIPAVPQEDTWNMYRGSLPMVDANANGLADSYGSPFACGGTSPLAADPGVPAIGGGFFYLVAEKNLVGEGTLGFALTTTGSSVERPKAALTSVCP